MKVYFFSWIHVISDYLMCTCLNATSYWEKSLYQCLVLYVDIFKEKIIEGKCVTLNYKTELRVWRCGYVCKISKFLLKLLFRESIERKLY